MNFSDSEIVASILNQEGFGATRNRRRCRPDFSEYLLNPGKGRTNRQEKANGIQKN